MNLKIVRERFARYGLQAGLHDVAKKTLLRAINLRILTCMELKTQRIPDEFIKLPHGFIGRFLQHDELASCAADPALDMDAAFVQKVLAKGDECYAILREDGAQDGPAALPRAVVSYGWYSCRPTHIAKGLWFHFDPRDVYMYKGFTRPAQRGLRLHAIGMAHALCALGDRGARAIVSYVESNNFASLRSCYRLGYEDIGRIVIIQPWTRPLIFSTGGCSERGIRVASGVAEA